MDETLYAGHLRIGRSDDVAGTDLIGLMELGNSLGLGTPCTMNDVRDAGHGCLQAGRLIEGAETQFNFGQVPLNEAFAAGWAEQDSSGQPA